MLLRGLMMDRPLLVTPIIQFAAAHHGDTAIVTRSVEGPVHRITYAESYARIQRLAHALVALGIKPGDRVATLAWNTWRHFELYYAIAGIGAVCLTLNPRLPRDQLKYILGHAEARALFFDATFAETSAAIHGSESRPFIALSNCGQGSRAPTALDYEELIAAHADAYDFPTFDENTAASLCYTSGTTGMPKGVLYSHRALVLHSFGLAAACGFSASEISLPVVPMFHVNAWGMPYTAPMTGAGLVFAGAAMDGASLFDLMDAEGVTCAQGVPTIWMSLIAAMRERGRKPRALTRVTVGGAAVPPSMVDAFENEFDVSVHHGWGMTEMTPVGAVNNLKPKFETAAPDVRARQKLKQGRLLFGVEMRIVDEAGRILANDGQSSGHIQVRGPWVVASYYKSDTDILTADGWFDTGDIGTLDPDGYLEITDRAKDIIKSGGEWISSVALENAAMGHPQIAHAAVIGIPHPKWLERPLLVCVSKTAARPTLGEMNAYLLQQVPKWWLPDALEFVDALPIGATGKVQKTKLRERFADRHLAAS